MLATIIDTDAFWHVALYGVLGAVGLVVAFGVALLGLDRAEGPEAGGAGGSASGAARVAWLLLTVLGGAACVALLAVGVWAMTQK